MPHEKTINITLSVDQADHSINVTIDKQAIVTFYYEQDFARVCDAAMAFARGLIEGVILAACTGCTSAYLNPIMHEGHHHD